MPRLRLHVDEEEELAPQPLPFPNLRPGDDSAVPPAPQDIAGALEQTIERMQRSLDELDQLADQPEGVYHLPDPPDPDDDPPAAA